MKDTLAGGVCTILSTMPGFPAWSDALMERVMGALEPVPDGVGRTILAEVDRHFEERPSVKSLMEWAWTLSSARPFAPPAPALPDGAGGVLRDGTLAGPGVACGDRPGTCPPYISRRLHAFFEGKAVNKSMGLAPLGGLMAAGLAGRVISQGRHISREMPDADAEADREALAGELLAGEGVAA